MLFFGDGTVCFMASFLADMQHVQCMRMLGSLWCCTAACCTTACCTCDQMQVGREGTNLPAIFAARGLGVTFLCCVWGLKD